jgi:amidase
VTDAQFVQASQFRERFRQHLAALLGDDGVLVLPTMPDIAPLRSADEASLEAYRNNAVQMLCIAGLSGFPRSRCRWPGAGAPLGISLLGPKGSDRSLIAMAEKLAQA